MSHVQSGRSGPNHHNHRKSPGHPAAESDREKASVRGTAKDPVTLVLVT